MALNSFVHSVAAAVVVDVAAAKSDFVMELRIEAVHTLVDFVVWASPFQKNGFDENYFVDTIYHLVRLPLRPEPNATTARSHVWYNCC